MSGIRVYQERGDASRRSHPLAASQSYDSVDPVYLVANKLTVSPTDGTEILVAELLGFAGEPAQGVTAPTRTNLTGAGAVENQQRVYMPLNEGRILFATKNWWNTGAAGTQTGRPEGGDLGGLFQISGTAGGVWGIEDTAATPATDAAARVVRINDGDGNPIDAADTTNGVEAVFEIANLHQLTQVGGG